jgi:hypothetical protein
MSKRFLTPVNLPGGTSFPSVGTVGDLFYRTDLGSLYAYNGTAWESGDAVTSVASLTDVELTALANNQVLIYNSTQEKWVNVDTDVLTGTNYDVLDGGGAGSMFLVTVNGGNANG